MRALIFAIGLTAIACQPVPATPPVQPEPQTATTQDNLETATKPAVPEMSAVPPHIWGISQDDWMVFAPFPSDDIHISMECVARGRVEIVAFNPAQGGRTLRLESEDVVEVIPAESIPGDGELVAIEDASSKVVIGTDHPVLLAFRRSGILWKNDPPEEMKLHAPTELETIRTFFDSCESLPG